MVDCEHVFCRQCIRQWVEESLTTFDRELDAGENDFKIGGHNVKLITDERIVETGERRLVVIGFRFTRGECQKSTCRLCEFRTGKMFEEFETVDISELL